MSKCVFFVFECSGGGILHVISSLSPLHHLLRKIAPVSHGDIASKEMADLSSCQVCSKIMRIFEKQHDDDAYETVRYELGNLEGVTRMPCPHSESFRQLWQNKPAGSSVSPESWSITIELSPPNPIEIIFSDDQQDNCKFIDLVAGDGPAHTGTSILLDSQWIDPSVPKSWYAACLDTHGSECKEPYWMTLQPDTNANPDWLIDVVDLCIVPFGLNTDRYVTLSYTWGNVECLKNTSGTSERLKEAGSLQTRQALQIPRTIRDAIGVTAHLGERYLWVDSLCIVQDDEHSLYKNLNAMHRIYANSTLCIVAYAGKDANHGLRGIKGISIPRCAGHTALDIAGGERLSYFNTPFSPWHPYGIEIVDEGSTYNQRGWTYQEFVFAKRRLIFTDGPLRWTCEGAKRGEETHGPLERDGWTTSMDPMYWMNDRLPSLGILRGIASEYNSRQFTYQSDALRAFLGIQNYLDGVFQGGLNYGHPEMFFDISLAWTAHWGVSRRTAPENVLSNEDQLPSWSWMGWCGAFFFDQDGEYHASSSNENGFTHSVAEWFTMRSPSLLPADMRPISCKWHHYKTLFESDPSKVLDGWEGFTSGTGSTICRVVSGTGPWHSTYPVPIPSSMEAIKSIEQRGFLFSKTTRCHFRTRSVVPLMDKFNWKAKSYVELCSTSGGFAGFLHLHQESEVARFLELGTVELVAVAKGWTTDLDDFLLAFQEQDKLMAMKSPTPDQPYRYRNAWDKKKLNCYFVLCVQWENGVAKRLCSGKVFAEVWERYQEPVDLILG